VSTPERGAERESSSGGSREVRATDSNIFFFDPAVDMEAEKLLAVLEEDGDGACLHGARLDASHQKVSTQETAVQKLRVSVVQAEQLMAKERGGASDPFVTVRLESVTRTTKVVAKTLAPYWNES